LISQRQLIGGNWVTSFYQYDGHGSVRGLTDVNGTLTDTYDYDAFGNLINQTGNTPNLYLYAGEQWDPDLGFYFLRARYMNPSTGRFVTMDSFEGRNADPRSLHKYTYVGNNPVNKIDPSGKDTSALGTLGASLIAGILSTLPVIASHIVSATIAATAVCAAVYAGTAISQYFATPGQNIIKTGTPCDAPGRKGRTFVHFTSTSGATGITGLAAGFVSPGATVPVEILTFAFGENDFNAPFPGAIFVTDLPVNASPGQLMLIGIFGDKQQFGIEFDEETAFHQGIRPYPIDVTRGIYALHPFTVLVGNFKLTRRF
jgi:RHS repeat-associated protein